MIPCKNKWISGVCRFGSKCRFSHDPLTIDEYRALRKVGVTICKACSTTGCCDQPVKSPDPCPFNGSKLDLESYNILCEMRKKEKTQKKAPKDRASTVCHFFRKGTCKKGKDCEFMHKEASDKDTQHKADPDKEGNDKEGHISEATIKRVAELVAKMMSETASSSASSSSGDTGSVAPPKGNHQNLRKGLKDALMKAAMYQKMIEEVEKEEEEELFFMDFSADGAEIHKKADQKEEPEHDV